MPSLCDAKSLYTTLSEENTMPPKIVEMHSNFWNDKLTAVDGK